MVLLFLFCGSVYGDEPEVKKEYWINGKLSSETYYKFGKFEKLETWFYMTGENLEEVRWKNGNQEELEKLWYKNGKENGFRKEWDRNGKLAFQGNFIDGNEEIK